MQERGDYGRERTMEGAQEARERAQQMADQGRSAMSERMEQGRERVEEGRERSADAIGSAAQQVRERTPDDGAAARAGEYAAEGMERTARYMREHDTNAMRDDLESYVREHPAPALGAAVAAGFLIGRILR